MSVSTSPELLMQKETGSYTSPAVYVECVGWKLWEHDLV